MSVVFHCSQSLFVLGSCSSWDGIVFRKTNHQNIYLSRASCKLCAQLFLYTVLIGLHVPMYIFNEPFVWEISVAIIITRAIYGTKRRELINTGWLHSTRMTRFSSSVLSSGESDLRSNESITIVHSTGYP